MVPTPQEEGTVLLMTSLSKEHLPLANFSPPAVKSRAPEVYLDLLSLTLTRGRPTSVAEETLRLLLGGGWDHCPHQVIYEGNQDDQEKQYLCLPDQKEPAEGSFGHWGSEKLIRRNPRLFSRSYRHPPLLGCPLGRGDGSFQPQGIG